VDDTFPAHGSLSRRAWATQEWLLTRRIVFYTNGQIIWSCKRLMQRETGEKFYSTARNAKWKNIIEQYSERQLTHLTDCLIALEGLKTELQKRPRIHTCTVCGRTLFQTNFCGRLPKKYTKPATLCSYLPGRGSQHLVACASFALMVLRASANQSNGKNPESSSSAQN
jgi:hypothetical protein